MVSWWCEDPMCKTHPVCCNKLPQTFRVKLLQDAERWLTAALGWVRSVLTCFAPTGASRPALSAAHRLCTRAHLPWALIAFLGGGGCGSRTEHLKTDWLSTRMTACRERRSGLRWRQTWIIHNRPVIVLISLTLWATLRVWQEICWRRIRLWNSGQSTKNKAV